MSRSKSEFRCSCLLCSLFLLFISVLCFVFTFSIFMMIFQPQELKFTVTNASLAEFNLTEINNNNNTLSYKLAINVTVRNPNNNVGVYFDRIEAVANYGGKNLSRANSISPFYQGHKNTTIFRAIFEGRQLVTFKDKTELDKYNFETSSKLYSIDVKIDVRARVRYGRIKTGRPSNMITCKLKVPLHSSETYSASNRDFKATRCRNVYIVIGQG